MILGARPIDFASLSLPRLSCPQIGYNRFEDLLCVITQGEGVHVCSSRHVGSGKSLPARQDGFQVTQNEVGESHGSGQ